MLSNFRHNQYFPHSVILAFSVLLLIVAVIFNSGFIGGVLGGAAGSFTLNDPWILTLCLLCGFFWRGSNGWLIATLIFANLLYRIWLSFQLNHHFGPLIYLCSSYGALIIGYLANAIAIFIRSIKSPVG